MYLLLVVDGLMGFLQRANYCSLTRKNYNAYNNRSIFVGYFGCKSSISSSISNSNIKSSSFCNNNKNSSSRRHPFSTIVAAAAAPPKHNQPILLTKTSNNNLLKFSTKGISRRRSQHDDDSSSDIHIQSTSNHTRQQNCSAKLGNNSRILTDQKMNDRFAHFGTSAVHVGQEPEQWDMNQVVPPISLSTTYKQNRPGEPKAHDYSRAGNPTRDVLQKNIAALEDGEHCRVYASGLAASMALANILKCGDHVLCSDDVYGGTQRFFRRVSVPQHGIQATFVDMTDMKAFEAALQDNTKMVWFETPSNPLLKVVDVSAIVAATKKFNEEIIVVVDNTFMSPYFQRPLSLGADVVLHSLTKYVNGHSDVIMGAVITNTKALDDHLFFMQLAVGAIPSAFDCFLVNRGIKTLHLRMKAHMENAKQVALFLEGNPRVQRVLYPELESHPQHEIHKKQAKGMSGMVSFYLRGGLEESREFLSNLKIFTLAESLGGYESLAELPAIMTHASVPLEDRIRLGISDNLIRLSVGIEDVDDLVQDLDQALKKAIPKLPKELL